MTQIFAHKITNQLSNDQCNRLLSVLSFSEKEKIYKFKKSQDAKTSLISRYLLRKVVSLFVRVKPDNLVLGENKYNRPTLEYPKICGLDFNVTHSGDWIAIAVNKYGRVGIDVEEIKPIDLSIAKNIYTIEELHYLYEQSGQEIENFYKIWTLKESFIKAVGEGLSYPLKDFHFEFRKNESIEMISRRRNGKWYFKMYDIGTDYKLALCASKNKFPDKINLIEWL